MKALTWTLLFVLLSCNYLSQEKKSAVVTEDSLEYYPPTPSPLNKDDFRRYHRAFAEFFNKRLPDNGFNGGIIMAKDGAIVYEKYKGFADLRKKDSLTDSTSFHIASVSKTFTGIATLRLVHENLISLEDSVQKFFPGLPYPGVTVKMLLNHRSGLPNYIYFMDKSDWNKDIIATNEDVLARLYSDKPAKTAPPDRNFHYSNTNYILLAMIIEKVTGKPFPQYMKEKFFDPLQMKHTYVFTLKDTLTAVPSFNYNTAVWENDFLEGTYGDKNIYSTPKDLLKWDQALYTDQLISRPLLDSAFKPYSNERKSAHNYGLGFRMLTLANGKKVIYHYGRWHGFNAAFARLVDEKATVIILGNKFNRGIYSAARDSYKVFGSYDEGNEQDEDEGPGSGSAKKSRVRKK